MDEALRLMRMSKVSLLESGHQKEQKDPVSLIYEAIRDDAQRSGKQSYTWGDLSLLIGNKFTVSMHDVLQWQLCRPGHKLHEPAFACCRWATSPISALHPHLFRRCHCVCTDRSSQAREVAEENFTVHRSSSPATMLVTCLSRWACHHQLLG